MALLSIRTYPAEVLKKKAEPVSEVTDELRKLADDMVETMYAAPGVGLAAPQVGVLKRLIVVDVSSSGDEGEKSGLMVLFNPELEEARGGVEFEEGCLSLPGFLTMVERSEEVVVKALDREGRPVRVRASGLAAIALQHEMDHLEGVLLLDRASMLKREFYKKRLKKQAAQAG